MLYVFILTIYSTGSPMAVEIADVDLTGPDCITRIEKHVADFPDFDFGVPSCEPQLIYWGPAV